MCPAGVSPSWITLWSSLRAALGGRLLVHQEEYLGRARRCSRNMWKPGDTYKCMGALSFH
jgi:hypothetical protein